MQGFLARQPSHFAYRRGQKRLWPKDDVIGGASFSAAAVAGKLASSATELHWPPGHVRIETRNNVKDSEILPKNLLTRLVEIEALDC